MYKLREVMVTAHAYAARPYAKAEEKPGVSIDFFRYDRKVSSMEYNNVTPTSFRRLCKVLEGTYSGTVSAQVDGENIITYFDVR